MDINQLRIDLLKTVNEEIQESLNQMREMGENDIRSAKWRVSDIIDKWINNFQ